MAADAKALAKLKASRDAAEQLERLIERMEDGDGSAGSECRGLILLSIQIFTLQELSCIARALLTITRDSEAELESALTEGSDA